MQRGRHPHRLWLGARGEQVCQGGLHRNSWISLTFWFLKLGICFYIYKYFSLIALCRAGLLEPSSDWDLSYLVDLAAPCNPSWAEALPSHSINVQVCSTCTTSSTCITESTHSSCNTCIVCMILLGSLVYVTHKNNSTCSYTVCVCRLSLWIIRPKLCPLEQLSRCVLFVVPLVHLVSAIPVVPVAPTVPVACSNFYL